MNTKTLNKLIESTISKEVRKTILESTGSKEVYHLKCDGEPIDTFESEDDANTECDRLQNDPKMKGKKLLVDKTVYESDHDMIDKLDNMGETLEKTTTDNMKENKIKAKSIAEAILFAKDNNIKKVSINETTFDVEEMWNKMEEEEGEMEEDFTFPDDDEFDHREDGYGDNKAQGDECFQCDGIGVTELGDDCELCGGTGIIKPEKEHNLNYADDESEPFEPQSKFDFSMNETKKNEKDDKKKDDKKKDDKKKDDKKDDEDDEDEKEKNPWDKFKGVDLGKSFSKFKDMKEGETCETCGKEICECGGINESKKVRLTETQLINMIADIVLESNDNVPGISITKRAQSQSKKENDSNATEVGKKIKNYLSFDGNDNPEFPKAIGKGDKKIFTPSDKDVEEIKDNEGRGSQDLDYDIEPTKEFKERSKGSLEGDKKLGNSTDAVNTEKVS